MTARGRRLAPRRTGRAGCRFLRHGTSASGAARFPANAAAVTPIRTGPSGNGGSENMRTALRIGPGAARQALGARPAQTLITPPARLRSVQDPIRELAESGFETDAQTVNKITEMGDAAFPELARLATTASDGEANRCAVHLLAVLGHYRAQLAINSFLLDVYKEEDDWVNEEMPGILAHMGPGAVPALSGMVRHTGARLWARHSAGRALASIAIDHPEHRPGVIETIKEVVADEKDIEVRTWLAECLLDLIDPDLYEYYENLLLTGTITSDVSDIDVLEQMYSGQMDPQAAETIDPLEMFEGARRWKNPAKGGPCPCGSGKKYKRCCMDKPF